MRMISKVMAIAGVAIAFCLALIAMATATRVGSQANPTVATTPEKANEARREYREAVLRRLEMGDRVTVPEDRIGYLEGDVKLISMPERAKVMTERSKSAGLKADPILDIESQAERLRNPELRAGLKNFARYSTAEQRSNYLNGGGKIYVDEFGSKPVPAPTGDAEKKCRDSCETITSILCREVCNWDCRIVNGEKVCEKSCSTICPEITNIVCKKVCD